MTALLNGGAMLPRPAWCRPVSTSSPAGSPRSWLIERHEPPVHGMSARYSLSPLAATLMNLPASVANKRLTPRLSPLDATLTKNGGRGGSYDRHWENRNAHPRSRQLRF